MGNLSIYQKSDVNGGDIWTVPRRFLFPVSRSIFRLASRAHPQYNSGRPSAKIGIFTRVASTVTRSMRTVSSASVSPPSISVSPNGSTTADAPKSSRLRSSQRGCRRPRNTGSRLPGCAGAYTSAYAAGAATPPAGSAVGPPPALAAPNSSAQGQPATPQPPAAPAVMTLEQAAGYLQVSPTDIQALIDDGSLQARRSAASSALPGRRLTISWRGSYSQKVMPAEGMFRHFLTI